MCAKSDLFFVQVRVTLWTNVCFESGAKYSNESESCKPLGSRADFP